MRYTLLYGLIIIGFITSIIILCIDLDTDMDINEDLSTEIALSMFSIAFIVPFIVFCIINIMLLNNTNHNKLEFFRSTNNIMAFFIIPLILLSIAILLINASNRLGIVLFFTSLIALVTTFKIMFDTENVYNIHFDNSGLNSPKIKDKFFFK